MASEPDVRVAPPTSTRRQAYLADAGLVGVTLIWGSTFIIIKNALGGVSPFEFVALRFGIAFFVLALLFPGRFGRLGPAERRAGFVIGIFLFAGYALQTAGLQFTTAAKAGFITGLSVLMVPLLAFAVLRQRSGSGVVLGIVLAPIGLWLLSFDGQASFGTGDLLVLGCAVAFAAHIISISAYAPRYDPLGLAIVQTGVCAALASLVAIVGERPLVLPAGAVLFGVLYTGLLGSALVLGVQTAIQRFTSPAHAALIFSLEPVFAALFAFLLAGETLGPRGLLGGALILTGTIVAELRRS
jgi:drug/metabolite transporter (DMT)-like permease